MLLTQRFKIKLPQGSSVPPARKGNPDPKAVQRLLVIARIQKAQLRGETQSSALRREGLSSTTYWRHCRAFEQNGLPGLSTKPMGRPTARRPSKPLTRPKTAIWELILREVGSEMGDQAEVPMLRQLRPLVPICVAKIALDRDEDSVLELIESGNLPWSWDIRGGRVKRREIRILTRSLLACAHNLTPPQESEDQILNTLLPPGSEDLTNKRLEALFSASQQHIYALVRSGQIQALNEGRRGPGGYLRASRDSVLEFLRKRRVS
jgi:hypothetical protein